MIAGVRAVVATLMDLSTNVSVEFAYIFYKHLQKGSTVSHSFTQAIRELRQVDDYKSPDNWAPFVLFGYGFDTLNILKI